MHEGSAAILDNCHRNLTQQKDSRTVTMLKKELGFALLFSLAFALAVIPFCEGLSGAGNFKRDVMVRSNLFDVHWVRYLKGE